MYNRPRNISASNPKAGKQVSTCPNERGKTPNRTRRKKY
jgi:hypothetical protein